MAELPCELLAQDLQSSSWQTHDLALLKGLLHLLQVGQVADIRADPLRRRTERADSIGNPEVDLHSVRKWST